MKICNICGAEKSFKEFNKDGASEHPSVVNSLDNLRPLWALENLKRKRK